MTTVFDAAGKGSAKACWVLMRRARGDRFESASAAAKPSPFQGVVFRKTKKPDMYWSAPRGAKRPVISALEIGYVRRSEVTIIWPRRSLLAGRARRPGAPNSISRGVESTRRVYSIRGAAFAAVRKLVQQHREEYHGSTYPARPYRHSAAVSGARLA